MNPSIGVVIPTYKSKKHLPHCLPAWIKSPLKPRILIIDSNSADGTVELAEKMGVETMVISQSDFNHGLTREKARKHLQTDIVVMATPDAYPLDEHVLDTLIQPLKKGESSISYARQLPHIGADFFEAFPREYNYPPTSHIRRWENRNQYGVYTIFCSDSCSAYLNSALDEIGGFPMVLTGEDTVVTSMLLQRGHAIAYVAEAQVHHSHGYSLMEEFHRYFDTGLARQEYRELVEITGKDSARGNDFVKVMMSKLIKENPSAIPYAAVQTGMKWLGYQLGKKSVNAPVWWKKRLSGHKGYWTSNPFLKKNEG